MRVRKKNEEDTTEANASEHTIELNKTEGREGELIAFLDDIKKESQTMMKDLIEMDDMLLALRNKIEEHHHVSKKELIKTINNIRLKIGAIESEDRRELTEEEVAESLLEKLKKWVDDVV